MSSAATAQRVAREIGFDPEIDAESACAMMGIGLKDLMAEIQFRHRKKMVQVKDEMAAVARAGQERRVLRCKDGDGGYFDVNIHPASYHYWGQRLGYECWQDPQFIREYKRDNPSAVVRTITRTTILRPDFAPRGVRGKRGRWAA